MNSIGLVEKLRKVEDNIATIRHWHNEDNKITKACQEYEKHISTRMNAGIIKIHTRFLSGIIVNHKKEIYSNMQDIMRIFRLKKEETNFIPRELFISKKLLVSWKLTKAFTNIEEELWERIEKTGLVDLEEYEIVTNKGSSVNIQMKNKGEVIGLKVESWPTRLRTAVTKVAIIAVLNKGGAKIRINTDVKGLKDVFKKKVLREEVN